MICRGSVLLVLAGLMGAGFLAVGESGAAPVPEPTRIVIKVADGATLEQIQRELDTAVKKARMPGGALVWGKVGTPAKGARRLRLQWGEDQHLDGWLIPAEEMERLMKHPRIHQIGLLDFKDGQLRVSHPSGPGSSPLPKEPAKRTREDKKARDETFGYFSPFETASNEAPAAPPAKLLPALRDATWCFRFIVWPAGAPEAAKDK